MLCLTVPGPLSVVRAWPVAILAAHQFALDLAFYLIEAAQLVRVQHDSKFIDIFHTDALGQLLAFDASLGGSCGIRGIGRTSIGAVTFTYSRAHFIIITPVNGDKRIPLLVSKMEPVHKLPDFGVKVTLIHVSALILAESGEGGKTYEKGKEKSFHGNEGLTG